MSTEVFYSIPDVIEVKDRNDLALSRAQELLSAVLDQRDYELVQLLRHPSDGQMTHEFLIVEVECHEVPPENPFGIKYRERLALCIPREPKQLIEVLALRQDFPVLMHQNQGRRNAPASLCLYFEPPTAVMRTWTPQAFLRRIQWWLIKSARSELHPADQPVEQLFFASKFEFVLPWNIEDIQQRPNQRFAVVRSPKRQDDGFTCFLEPFSADNQQTNSAAYIKLNLPPIVHGFVERDPSTLGELADILGSRGVDFITPLREVLQDGVDDMGVPQGTDDKNTVILLRTPIQRSSDSDPDLPFYRAFFIPTGALELGCATGALFPYEGRYFKKVAMFNQELSIEWRAEKIFPMQVLFQNDAEDARQQSGIDENGTIGVLVGAGSLGSAMLNIWGRSGWGQWTVVDNDHIKPHNLSRHQAYTQHIGVPKAKVAASLHAAVMDGATEIVPIVADACDLENESVSKALTNATLVVDASTILEYPRATSSHDELPRHVSVFVTPSGLGSVLLAEDAKRQHRLRTLEAQYYRALIQHDWGANHLIGDGETFWSGASCRDVSFVMPYSHILSAACTLSEQIQAISTHEESLIRIWQQNHLNGGVEVYDVPVEREFRYELGEFELFIDEGAINQLQALRQQGFPNETGGVLLGYYDFNIQAVIIVAGLPAPSDSNSSPDSFERGTTGLSAAVEEASNRTASMVRYLGEWHSHPPGHSATPSQHDLAQLAYLAQGMADEGLPAVQLIVGEHEIQVLHGRHQHAR